MEWFTYSRFILDIDIVCEVMGFKTTYNSELQSIQSFMVNIQLPQYVKASLLGNFG